MGLVGIDQISGQARYTAGVPELLDGLEVVLIAVGLFAVSEALYNVLYEGKVVETQNKMSKVHMTREEWSRSWPAGCARPRSASRSAPFRPAAARSRPS
jgi:putative tricarboxylic transport membrane protein